MQFEYQLNPRKIAIFLSIIAVYFAVQSLIGEYLLENVLSRDAEGFIISLIDLTSVNAEETIPTWYATILLFLTAVLLAFLASVKQRTEASYRWHWLGLAIIFLYLSVDEGAVIHEIFSDPMQEMFNTSGFFAFGWQIVFIPLVIIFVLAYLRFLTHLPPCTRNLFILAGIIYVGGAIVVEGISANQWDVDGGVSFTYLAIATVEEFLEMMGVILFIYALLGYVVGAGYTAVLTPPPNESIPSKQEKSPAWLKWMLVALVVLIIGSNMLLFSWATGQQTEDVVDLQTIPFYQTMSEQYAGQGVIILGIPELLQPDNPAAQPYANSLLTLFNDVIVVTLPSSRMSIAFASQALPFDQEQLQAILLESGEEEYTILGVSEIISLSENSEN